MKKFTNNKLVSDFKDIFNSIFTVLLGIIAVLLIAALYALPLLIVVAFAFLLYNCSI